VSDPSTATLATADLRREHELIRRGLTVLERLGRRLATRREVDQTTLSELVTLLRRLADQCHHGKEEGHLFPSMREKGLPAGGRLAALLAAHGEGRDYLGTLSGLPSPAERAAAALLYVRVTRQHLDTEEREVFPVADGMFAPAEQAELARSYVEMERRTFGSEFRDAVSAQLERLEDLVPD
jgi:hemerythrin-like domain-containing protein